MTVEAPRKPWLAGLLTLAAPGMGQIYNGELNKGLFFFAFYLAISLAVFFDLRSRSYDSRFWGFVDVADVRGKAAVIYWSWDADARRVRWERIGKAVE